MQECANSNARRFLIPPHIKYRCDGWSGCVANAVIMDFSLWDANQTPMWCVSKAVSVTEYESNATDVDFEVRAIDKRLRRGLLCFVLCFCIHLLLTTYEFYKPNIYAYYPCIVHLADSRGEFIMTLQEVHKNGITDSHDTDIIVKTMELKLRVQFVDKWFGTSYAK